MTTDATRAHIDAETLAAWAEHSLSADAAAAVELHLSNCGRCQEVLAAFVRSAPATGAVVIPFWSRRPVQWSTAGLAAAAALVAFVWIGRPPALPTPESTIAQAPIDSMTSASASAPAELRRDKSDSVAKRLAEKPTSPKASNQAESKKEAVPARPAAVAAPPPPPAAMVTMPPPAGQPPVMSPPVTVSAAAPVVTPLGGTAAGNFQMAARSESVFKDAMAILEVAAPEPALASRMAAGRGGGVAGLSALNQSAGPTRWRVLGGTRIERTTDAGATWIALPIQPVLTTPLVAGGATSQFVCWFVGAEGVVLVATDGRTFRRASLPEAVNLTGVVPMDGMRATVTADDGRKFSTIDGGLTWK